MHTNFGSFWMPEHMVQARDPAYFQLKRWTFWQRWRLSFNAVVSAISPVPLSHKHDYVVLTTRGRSDFDPFLQFLHEVDVAVRESHRAQRKVSRPSTWFGFPLPPTDLNGERLRLGPSSHRPAAEDARDAAGSTAADLEAAAATPGGLGALRHVIGKGTARWAAVSARAWAQPPTRLRIRVLKADGLDQWQAIASSVCSLDGLSLDRVTGEGVLVLRDGLALGTPADVLSRLEHEMPGVSAHAMRQAAREYETSGRMMRGSAMRFFRDFLHDDANVRQKMRHAATIGMNR
eukprot:TRINITY_DN5303_c0_g1_i1.p1 TRINITY_DN5303_c0_g1~~TRINITY_DN5303_c0_g1_i1.p1  ORF type:complete len:341 (-),score=38.31 TRINITY_DN5303_c0_g1_i1:547-1416(-)